MEVLLLYLLGPLLAIGLPTMLLFSGLVLGAMAARNWQTLLGIPVILFAGAALAVPAAVPLSSNVDWPAPWWFGIFYGRVKYEPTYWLAIGAASTGLFWLAVILRFMYDALLRRR